MKNIVPPENRDVDKALSSLPAPKPHHSQIVDKDVFPLSLNQYSIWLQHILDPNSAVNNVVQAIRFHNEFNIAALKRTLQRISDRHPALRTTFTIQNEQPIQVVHKHQPVFFRLENACDWGDTFLNKRLAEETYRTFDLETGPLFRAFLFTRASDEHIFFFTMHHIITDMWSIAIFLKELAAIYQNEISNVNEPLPVLKTDYYDFVTAQQDLLTGPKGQQLHAYWKEQLSGELPVLNLPTDRPRQTVNHHRGASHLLMLDKTLTDLLKELADIHNTTLFSVVLAAFQVLLHRYSGQDDILIGTPKAGRTLKTARMINYFINPVVLRANLSGNPSFVAFLHQVHQTVEGAFAHDMYPFQKLIEDFQPKRDLSISPFFQVVFAWQKSIRLGDGRGVTSGAIGNAGIQVQLNGLLLESFSLAERIAPNDLSLLIGEVGEGLVVTFEYKRDLFEANTIARMAGHFETLLKSIGSQPDTPIAYLPLLTESESIQIATWNDTAVSPTPAACFHHLFEAQVERTPEQTALIFNDESLTYEELNGRANQLAHILQTRGIGPEILVGIATERSIETIVGILGVLKAGGAYVPLDPAYPPERLAIILNDANINLLLTQNHLSARFSAAKTSILCLDTDWEAQIRRASCENPSSATTPENLAYVIFTSGSTGTPKGVLIPHQGLGNLAQTQIKAFAVRPETRVLQFASYSFDVSISDIITTFLAGATLVLASQADLMPGEPLKHLLKTKRINLLQTVPSVLAIMPPDDLPDLETIVSGGEICPAKIVAQWSPGRRFINIYGPTEATIATTMLVTDDGSQPPPIGRPIDNVQLYILDKFMQPVPVGIPGELYIGSPTSLARGYLNRPELTVERFVPNPFYPDSPSEKLYKTGDLVKYRSDGNLDFLGRSDNQVKIRGFRIELGEIEVVLSRHPSLREVVVTAQETNSGGHQLVAYVIPEHTIPPTDDLHDFARASLPDYMIPAAFVAMESFPLTTNKKIDRKALPQPDWNAIVGHASFVAPQTPQEELTAVIWREVLGLDQVGIHDNFFELGGHSLLATQIVSRIRKTAQVELPIRAIFETPTIAELARHIVELQTNGSSIAPKQLTPVERTTLLPLSFSQERMWFLYQLDTDSTAYNIPGAVHMKGPLDKKALEWSINQIIARHESLRTRFTAVNGRPTVMIDPVYTFTLPVEDCRMQPESERQAYAISLMEAAARTPFRLDQLPLFQMKLFQLGDEEFFLLINMHHIISDQWSFGVLSNDLAAYYQAHTTNQPVDLPEMTIQAVDHAVWQRQLATNGVFDDQMAYWKQQLDGIPTLDLPSDRPRPAVQTTNGTILTSPLPHELTDSLHNLSQQESVSPFMVLLAGFNLLLSRYTGVEDIAIGSPIANRHQLQSETLISTLVNTLVLRTDLSGNPTFRQLLKRVQRMALDAYAHQDIPFERLVEALQPARDTSRSPLFQAFFNMQNAPFSLPELLHMDELTALMIDRGAAQFDLSLSIDMTVTHQASLEYNTDLFDAARMERLLGHYWTLLETAVTHPDRHISDLPLLTHAEIQQLNEWNDTAVPYPTDACLHHLFEAQVEQTPMRTAVTFEDRSHTYDQLNRQANRLARHLQSLGVGPGGLVGINLERSLEMIVALFAVHKAGAAYIPLDPAFPQDRLDFMLADSQAQVLITQTSLLADRPDQTDLQFVCVDRDAEALAQYDDHNLPHSAAATDLAYVIYTSGSTGKPKGVQIEQRSAVNFLNAMRRQPGLTADDVVLSVTTLSFDIAVLEIFLPLLNGARVELVSRDTAVNAAQLQSALKQSGATLMQATPTTWRMLIEAGWPGDPRLKILCGGEAMPRDLADQLLPRCGQLWNMYGPTETTVWSSVHLIRPGTGPISIGRPIDNTTFYILDKEQRPLPIGVPGELTIGGDGLARGYLNRPELTAERFIDLRLASDDDNRQSSIENRRLYRTGDLARFLPDGNVELFCRIDNQVKVRGYRIELGEIESVLAGHPALREVVVTAQEIGAGDQRLVAYYIPETIAPAAEDLRAFARASLPDYMIPAAFVAMGSFPLTPNKKIDRKALPAPQTIEQAVTAEFAAPQDALEIQLTRIWERVLGISGIGRHDNFFELGGHSLLAVRVFAQIEQITQMQFPLTILFRAPTIAQLATVLRSKGWQTRWTSLVPVQPNGSRPIFFHVTPFLISVLSFSELARHLGDDQPLYGLQPQGVEGDDPYHERVADMAAHYIKEIRTVQPEGPYMLGGHCAGNWVAFEMAQQLQAQGEEISLLVLVDSEPPNIAPPPISPIKYFFSRAAFYWKDGRFWDALLWQLGLVYQRLVILRMGEENARRVAAVRNAHACAHRQYHSGTFDGNVLLIRSHESTTLRDKDWHLRWSELINGRLQHEVVPGTHAGLLIEPGVNQMAAKIRAAIDERLQKSGRLL